MKQTRTAVPVATLDAMWDEQEAIFQDALNNRATASTTSGTGTTTHETSDAPALDIDLNEFISVEGRMEIVLWRVLEP